MINSRVTLPILFACTLFFVSSPAAFAQSGSPEVHVVATGETLYGIARQYGLSIEELKSANGLASSLIQPGQRLQLPAAVSNTNSTRYTVKQGDTLWGIARRYDTTVSKLRELNELASANLRIGQELLLVGSPRGTAGLASRTKSDANSADDESSTEGADEDITPKEVDPDRVVDNSGNEEVDEALADVAAESTDRGGIDSNAAEAKSDGSTMDTVKSGGGITTEARDVVVRLDGETEAESFDFHTVAPGESWESLAYRYGTDVDALRLVNGKTAVVPRVGTRIRIPADPTVFHYRVEDGDTIERIAKWFTIDASVIRRINDLPDGTVTPGQTLRIPDLNSPILKSDYVPPTSTTKRAGDGKVINAVDKKDPGIGAGQNAKSKEEVNSTPTKNASAPTADQPTSDANPNRSEVRVYPDSFKGRLMANGNAYNPKRSTISHPTIAFGTQVRVINLSSGVSAFAIVADRPLPGSSQVDLSSTLASELGIRNSGDAQVMIETVK